MQVEIERTADSLYICLGGELDHHAAPYVRSQIDEAIACAHPKQVVLDFTKVSFMDSSGIGLVMGRYKLLSAFHCPLKLCGLSPHVYKVMRLAGLEGIAELQKLGCTNRKTKKSAAVPSEKQQEENHETAK